MQDARCLKVKPRERAFKQFKSPVLNVLRTGRPMTYGSIYRKIQSGIETYQSPMR